ncbi:MAG: DUF3179 domain-containing protein, partial [Actinomycetota bacterium]
MALAGLVAAVLVLVVSRTVSSPEGGNGAAAPGARFPWEIDPPPASLVPLDEIKSGGPPPDGIPPIDDPKFVSVGAAEEWLDDREPVLSLVHRGEARAYPLQILTWHEIVNDTVAGDPITVTFCPLCNSGIAFDRRVRATDDAKAALGTDEAVLDFGTSGRLYRSNLVMYDRQTKSLWIQFTGRAVAGPFMRTNLRNVPVQMVSWSDFKGSHPDARVLSRETGNSRDYGRNPYAGYDDINGSPFLFDGETDRRLSPMERVVAVRVGEQAKAYRYRSLRDVVVGRSSVIEDEVGGEEIVVFYRLGTSSALDQSSIAASRDVGATGVFTPEVDGRRLSFEPNAAGFMDRET